MNKYKNYTIILLFLVSCSSFNSEKNTISGRNSNENKKIVTFKSKEYFLSKTSNYAIEQDFQKIVEDSFSSVFTKLDFDIKKSFSYIINPKGGIYPFSRVEVRCLVREDLSSKKANEICSSFFEFIDKKYDILKKELP